MSYAGLRLPCLRRLLLTECPDAGVGCTASGGYAVYVTLSRSSEQLRPHAATPPLPDRARAGRRE